MSEKPEQNKPVDTPEPEQAAAATDTAEPATTAAEPTPIEAEPVAADKADSEAEPEVSIESLQTQLAEAEEKAAKHWDMLLRQKAESENLQKRVQRDLDNARKFALEKFANELLTVKDSMEMGLDAADQADVELPTVKEGMALTLKQLSSVLEKFDINEINPLQEKFNPEWHEAMAMQPVPDVEEGTVVVVHQKGYQLSGRLLRPARVVVAKAMA